MSVYHSTFGKDKDGCNDQRITKDGVVVFEHIGYPESIKWLRGVIRPGDRYEEELNGVTYARMYYEQFMDETSPM